MTGEECEEEASESHKQDAHRRKATESHTNAERRSSRDAERRKSRFHVLAYTLKKARMAGVKYPGEYSMLNMETVKVIQQDQKRAGLFATALSDPSERKLGHRIVCFTDGSFLEDWQLGGSGVAFKHITTPTSLGYDLEWGEIHIGVKGIQYAFDAEMLGISMALELAIEQIRDVPALPTRDTDVIKQSADAKAILREDAGLIESKPRIYIFTDSVASQNHLRSYLRTTGQTRQILLLYHHPIFISMIYNLNRLVRHGFQVEIHWVKAHSGIQGNELADMLAGKAAHWLKGEKWWPTPEIPFELFRRPKIAGGSIIPLLGKKRKHEDTASRYGSRKEYKMSRRAGRKKSRLEAASNLTRELKQNESFSNNGGVGQPLILPSHLRRRFIQSG